MLYTSWKQLTYMIEYKRINIIELL